MEKKYSIWSHYRFMYERLWKYDWKLVLTSILESIFSAAKPFVAVLLPFCILVFGCKTRGILAPRPGIKPALEGKV